jgi:HD-like signal output (HDOD) protein
LEQAVTRLGLTTTRQYVDAISHRTLYGSKNKKLLELLNMLWEHSLSCAYASRVVSELLNLELPEDAFTLGLLHDIGKLVLWQAIAELQAKNRLGEKINTELLDTIDTHHGKFGASLLKMWKFSTIYIDVAIYHDNLEQADPISKGLLTVHFANLMAKSIGYDMGQQAEVDLESAESARLLGLDSTMISEIRDQTEGLMEEMKEYFA